MINKELNRMATEMVGDGKKPNLYFVSLGSNVQLVTTDWDAAYTYWLSLPRNVETLLEDRLIGLICDTSPVEERSTRLTTSDCSYMVTGVRQ